MNGYQRPGYSTASAADSHVLRVVSTCRPFAAQILAAEERHASAVAKSEQMRRQREAGSTPSGQATAPTWLRMAAGSALVHLGQRLQGAPTTIVATGTAG